MILGMKLEVLQSIPIFFSEMLASMHKHIHTLLLPPPCTNYAHHPPTPTYICLDVVCLLQPEDAEQVIACHEQNLIQIKTAGKAAVLRPYPSGSLIVRFICYTHSTALR